MFAFCLNTSMTMTIINNNNAQLQYYMLFLFLFQCTYKPPVCSVKETYNEVSRYKHKWGIQGQTYSCFYHPDNPTLVFRERSVTQETVLHAMIWPSVMIIIFTLGLFFMFKGTEWTIWVFSCGLLDKDDNKSGHEAIL